MNSDANDIDDSRLFKAHVASAILFITLPFTFRKPQYFRTQDIKMNSSLWAQNVIAPRAGTNEQKYIFLHS